MKLHKESKGTLIVAILFIAFVGTISIYYLHLWSLVILIPLLVMLGLIFWFFRVPTRAILDHTENVIAPVDGKVVMIKEVFEDEVLKANCIQVSIFMSPLNVHICRYPVSGEVNYKKYHPGKYPLPRHKKPSPTNERTPLPVQRLPSPQVVFRQIAGYVARRIVFYCNVQDEAKAGHEFGFIKFGSRMDVFLPLDTEILCKIGDKTKGGLDVIARMRD